MMVTGESCTQSESAASNKCDLVRCFRDNECENYECDDGYCWSYRGRPAACVNDDINAQFYRCNGLKCNLDVNCYSKDCSRGICTEDYDDDDDKEDMWEIIIGSVIALIVIGLGAFFLVRYLRKKKQAELQAAEEDGPKYTPVGVN